MDVKDKASEIYNEFDTIIYTDQDHYIQVAHCCFFHIDSILNLPYLSQAEINYWNNVKLEIIKLTKI